VLAALTVTVAAIYGQEFASSQLKTAEVNLAYVQKQPACADPGTRDVSDCSAEDKKLHSLEVGLAQGLMTRSARYAEAARATQLPVGAFGFTAGHMATGLGLILAFVFAAAHVAAEWRRGTIVYLAAAEPRASRIFFAKAASVWLAMLAVGLVAALVLAATGPILSSRYSLPSATAKEATIAFAIERIGAAALILALFSIAAACSAFLARAEMLTIATGVASLLVITALASLPVVDSFGPAAAVSGLAQVSSLKGYHDHVWLVPHGGSAGAQALSMATALAVVVAVLVATYIASSRRDIAT
jgi:hypothetical protein